MSSAIYGARLAPAHAMNPWEDKALQYGFPETANASSDDAEATPRWRRLQDPVIYPGIYSSSNLDIMSILLQIFSRPNPQISLGPVDASVAITVSDLDHPGHPIIYASDAFYDLTGFSGADVLGKNALALQAPPRQSHLQQVPLSTGHYSAIERLQQIMDSRTECQMQTTSYKKSGQCFANIISIIPISMPESGANYSVWFHGEYQ